MSQNYTKTALLDNMIKIEIDNILSPPPLQERLWCVACVMISHTSHAGRQRQTTTALHKPRVRHSVSTVGAANTKSRWPVPALFVWLSLLFVLSPPSTYSHAALSCLGCGCVCHSHIVSRSLSLFVAVAIDFVGGNSTADV